MRNYNASFIKNYIENNKDKIETVYCGMKEDWSWTADPVYENGEYLFDLNNKTVSIAGICGSYWATPVMEVEFKDGETKIVDCYETDDKDCFESDKENMKLFARMTGGMDSVQ